MVSYVLLVVIALGVSVLVYSYLRLQVPKDVPSCPDGVSLIIQSASCSAEKKLTLVLLNKGRFSIDKVFIRVGKQGEVSKKLINQDDTGISLDPGETISLPISPKEFNIGSYISGSQGEVEVQPVIKDEKTGKDAACSSLNSKNFICG